ncbi:unnamed protein product [Spodoptera littoralis]|uniref:Peptidase S1 domain-containing protein n=1 Tax=Spodoptera littoralis TaxID=7109 RepID=A0A9P0N730_SPOLI|nr:unnamed protein product [Spodoptera littoralis]CAH1643865.1 unnamed protein product [Spodoptera littoralis]
MFFRNMWCRILLFVAVVSLGHADEKYDLLQGEPTTIEKYPFAVQIIRYRFGGIYSVTCGGSLVTTLFVLSAARCFVYSSTTRTTNITTTASPKIMCILRNGLHIDPEEFRIRVGSTRIQDSGGIRYEVSEIIIHENYRSIDNDIALVRTKNPVSLGPNIAIIKIPQEEVMVPDNATVTVIRWGSAGNKYKQGALHEVPIKKVNWQRCKNIYSDSTNITITDNMICCGGLGYNMEPAFCTPDIGNPLLYGDNLVGLAIWFGSCRNNDIPRLFTRISKYTSWIDNTIKRSIERSDPHPGASSMNKIGVTLLIPVLYSVFRRFA